MTVFRKPAYHRQSKPLPYIGLYSRTDLPVRRRTVVMHVYT